MAERPEFAMKIAVKGMLPKNSIGDKSLTRLRVYRGSEHGQQAQKPVPVSYTHLDVYKRQTFDSGITPPPKNDTKLTSYRSYRLIVFTYLHKRLIYKNSYSAIKPFYNTYVIIL